MHVLLPICFLVLGTIVAIIGNMLLEAINRYTLKFLYNFVFRIRSIKTCWASHFNKIYPIFVFVFLGGGGGGGENFSLLAFSHSFSHVT